MPRYLITPLNPEEQPYELEAGCVSIHNGSGRINFFQGEDIGTPLIASELNVRFRVLPAADPAADPA